MRAWSIRRTGSGSCSRAWLLLVDPFFNAAILDDDPVAMRTFVEREAARLAAEDASRETPPKKRTRGPKARR